MTKTIKAKAKKSVAKKPLFPGFTKHPRTVYLEEGLVRHEDRAHLKRFQKTG